MLLAFYYTGNSGSEDDPDKESKSTSKRKCDLEDNTEGKYSTFRHGKCTAVITIGHGDGKFNNPPGKKTRCSFIGKHII